MRLVIAALLLIAPSARALDVTSAAERARNVLDYVAGREDLDPAAKASWDAALRGRFGGSALTPGTDEGITVAKSVVSAAIFFAVAPDVGARAAYDAYHDTARWVPAPIAINYQVLGFQGRKPKANPRQLTFNFPRYFNEEIAVELVLWWDEALAAGRINEHERNEVRRLLAETRALMRPMLLARLFEATKLAAGARGQGTSSELARELARLEDEIQRDYRAVAQTAAVYERRLPAYERYRALAIEMGATPQPAPPVAAAPPKAVAPPPMPSKPPPLPPPASDSVAEHEQPEAPSSEASRSTRVPAPLAGESLVQPFQGWQQRLQAAAKTWIGVPYRLGGTSRSGVDCSAFVQQSYRQGVGIELPRNSESQSRTGTGVQKDSLKAGDLLFFDTLERGRVTHVGLYLGDGTFVHASSSRGVTQDQLDKAYYQRAYRVSRRLLRS